MCFFQAEDGIRDLVRSRGLGDVYKRQAEYAKIGIGKSTGTKLISASGHINKPGVYEIEMGLSLIHI